MKAILEIKRGTPGVEPRVESFEVAFEHGQSILLFDFIPVATDKNRRIAFYPQLILDTP